MIYDLKGPNLKAKANAAQAVGELIQIAESKSASEDFNLQLARILPSSTGGEMNCKNRKNNTEHLFWLRECGIINSVEV